MILLDTQKEEFKKLKEISVFEKDSDKGKMNGDPLVGLRGGNDQPVGLRRAHQQDVPGAQGIVGPFHEKAAAARQEAVYLRRFVDVDLETLRLRALVQGVMAVDLVAAVFKQGAHDDPSAYRIPQNAHICNIK